jgi:hypothetical protein
VTPDDRANLRLVAQTALNATTPRTVVERRLGRWSLQTSNSFRRIGCHGDGDVLCGTKHPIDGHPDLLAPPGVLDYIVAVQPCVVLELLEELRQCAEALELSRKHHAEDHDELERLRESLEDKLSRAQLVDGVLASTLPALEMLVAAADRSDVADVRRLAAGLLTAFKEISR